MTGRRRFGEVAAALLFVALAGACGAAAAPRDFDVVVGLSGHVVPDRWAPVRLAASSLPRGAASLRIAEKVGNAWRGEATMTFEVPLIQTRRSSYETVIPIYDGDSPLRVELLSADGRALGYAEADLRSRRADAPFPVGVGTFGATLGEDAVYLAAAELPADGGAYDAANSVWIGSTRDGLDAVQWDGLARWVLRGGTLVVFTGADFLLLDAPRLRDLLPVLDPTLAESPNGRVLTGRPRNGATTAADRNGAPWLVARPYGLGTVLLVTTAASAVGSEDVDLIRRRIAPGGAAWPLVAAASDLLDEQPVDGPGRWAAVALVLASVSAALAVLSVTTRRGPRAATLTLCGAFAVLALSAWVYTSRASSLRDLYGTRVRLVLQGSVGAQTACSALYSAARDPQTAEVEVDGMPYALSSGSGSGLFDVACRDDEASVALAPAERRTLLTRSDAPVRLRAQLRGDEEVRVTNGGPRVEDAVLLVDGEAYALPVLEPGETTTFLVSPAAPSELRLGSEGGATDRLLRVVAEVVPLDRRAWLLAGEVWERNQQAREGRAHWREVRLYVVEVARD